MVLCPNLQILPKEFIRDSGSSLYTCHVCLPALLSKCHNLFNNGYVVLSLKRNKSNLLSNDSGCYRIKTHLDTCISTKNYIAVLVNFLCLFKWFFGLACSAKFDQMAMTRFSSNFYSCMCFQD